MRRLAAVALLGLVASCSTGTFALMTFDANGVVPPGIKSLDLQLMLDGKPASTTISGKNGADLTLPTTASLEIQNGSGQFDVVAIARDAQGSELGRGSATGTIVSGATARISTTIDFGAVADMGSEADLWGTDGSADMTPSLPILGFDHQPQFDFGTIVTNKPSPAATFTLTNSGDGSSGTLGGAVLTGSGAAAFSIQTDNCMGKSLAPQATCTVLVVMSTATASTPTAQLGITASPGGSATVQLMGTAVTPGAITLSPSPAPFPPALVNGGSDATLTVSNSGGAQTGPISFTLGGNDKADFSIASSTCAANMQLAPNGSCTVSLHFAPTVGGSKSASLTVNATPGGPGVDSLTATALTPATLSFTQATYSPASPVTAGTSTLITLTLQNMGTQASGNLPAVQTLGNSEFTVVSGGSCTAGSPLAGGGSCTILVKFAPTSYGTKTDSLTLSASPGGTPTANLSGIGEQVYTLTVAANGATGTDKVTSADGDIRCGAGATACTHAYAVTTGPPPQDTLTATTGASSRLVSITGDCTASPCTLTMNADHTNIAVNWQATWVASLTISGTGTGTVTSTSSPTQASQFNCSSGTCQVTFDTSMSPVLTAAPSAGGAVFSWTGCASGGGTSSTCTLTPSNASSTVTFNAPSQIASWTINGTNLNALTPETASATATNVSAAGLAASSTLTNIPEWNNVLFASGWPAESAGLDPSKYFSFSVTAAASHSIAYRDVSFSLWGVGEDNPNDATWAIRSSVDGFTNNLDGGTVSSGIGFVEPATANVAAIGMQSGTVTFRIYIFQLIDSSDGEAGLTGTAFASGGTKNTGLIVTGIVF